MAQVHVYQARARIQAIRISTRYLRKVMDHMHDVAVRNASGGPYSTGELARSLKKRGPYAEGIWTVAEVYSDSNHAIVVERGARVHNIFPKGISHVWRFGDRKRPQLKFVWHGRVVYTPHVPMSPATIGRSHPGMTGKHFLLKAVVQTGIRYRLKLRIYGE